MSIYVELTAHVNKGGLFLLNPSMPGQPGTLGRTMYVSAEINFKLEGPWETEQEEMNCQVLKRDFDRFMTGQIIATRMPPRTSVNAFIALLDPPRDEIWEIRTRESRPQFRALGSFADTDVFVALTLWERSDLDASADWRYAMVECGCQWRRLFPAYSPKSGRTIHDYISNNTFPV